MLIARLVAQLNCYAPERADETWARLRQLGARRERLVTEATACVQQLRDLLECAWPRVLAAAADPFASINWCAALAVVLERCDGRPERLSRAGLARFEAAVVRELPRWGGSRRRRAIIEAVFVALVDPTGVWPQRLGALERARWVLADWRSATTRLVEVESPMVQVLDELGLTVLRHQPSPGSPRSPRRRCWLRPATPSSFRARESWSNSRSNCVTRDNASGTFNGRSHISRRGRPRLRLAAWRAVWSAFPHNPVMPPATGSDHPPTQSAHRRSGPRRHRRGIAALDPRHHNPKSQLEAASARIEVIPAFRELLEPPAMINPFGPSSMSARGTQVTSTGTMSTPSQSSPHSVARSRDQTRSTNYVETSTSQPTQPLTKTSYERVFTATRREMVCKCGRSSLVRPQSTPPGVQFAHRAGDRQISAWSTEAPCGPS